MTDSKPGYVWTGTKWEPIIGPPGEPGPPMTILGSVATPAALPATGKPGDAYMIDLDGHLYAWVGTRWFDSGKVRGDKGDPGETLHPSGFVADFAAIAAYPIVPPTGNPGDANYNPGTVNTVLMTQDAKHLYVYNPTSAVAIPAGQPGAGWVDMGVVQGPPGPDGHSATLQNAVDDFTKLPTTGNKPGDMRVTLNDGHIWGWDSITSRWNDGGQFVLANIGRVYVDSPQDGDVFAWDGYMWTNTPGYHHDAHDVPGGGLSPWVPQPWLAYSLVEHHGHVYWSKIDAPDTAEPGVPLGSASGTVTHPADNGGNIIPGPTGSQPGLDDPPTDDARYTGRFFIFGNSGQSYTPQTGPLAGQTIPDGARVIFTGNPLVGNDGIIWIPQSAWDLSAPYQWTAPATDPWEKIDTHHLSDLSDVNAPTPSVGDVLEWDGARWGLSRRATGIEVLNALSSQTLESHADVDVTGIQPHNLIEWDGTHWVPTSRVTRAELNVEVAAILHGVSHSIPVLKFVASEAEALALTPRDGDAVIVHKMIDMNDPWHAFAEQVMVHELGAWIPGGPPIQNETHLVEDEHASYTWNGSDWVKTLIQQAQSSLGGCVGSVMQMMLTEVQFKAAYPADSAKWVLADGRDVTGSRYATLTGNNNVPDLRAMFIRSAGNNANGVQTRVPVGSIREDRTRVPRDTAFTVSQAGGHHHDLAIAQRDSVYAASGRGDNSSINASGSNHMGFMNGETNWSTWGSGDGYSGRLNGSRVMWDDGAHTHTIGGGDIETAPFHVPLWTFIKVED